MSGVTLPTVRLLALAGLFAVATTGCRGTAPGAATPAGCRPAQRQQAQFPANHVLPGSPEPRYLSEPPTSGPHLVPSRLESTYREPLSRPVQVGVLELGNILLQYRDPAVAGQVEALAGNGVVVAPNPGLAAAVVLTGWLYLQTCDGVDAATIVQFRAATKAGTPTTHVR